MRLLTVKQIAQTLGVHRVSIYRWAEAGVIPSFKIGGIRRFDLDAVLEALADKTHEADEAAEA